MAANERLIVPLYVDVEQNRLVDSAGDGRGDVPQLWRGNQYLFEIHLVQSDGTTAYALPTSGVTFYGGIDTEFDPTSVDLCQSNDSNFNVAGEFEGGNADQSLGQLSMRLSCNTTALKDELGSNAKKTAYLAVWMDNGTIDTLLFHIEVDARQIAVDPGVTGSPELSAQANGAATIANGATSVVVSGLTLTGAPSIVLVNVGMPSSSGPALNAYVDLSTVTSAGFTAYLSAAAPSTGYEMHYVCIV